MVYAGINHGANLSTDALYSGTISAAAEGLFAGYPAVAVSVCSHQPAYFDGACRLALAVFDGALEEKGRGSLISVNVPNIPAEEIRGIRPARLGTLVYDEWFEELPGEGHEPGSQVFRYTGTPQEEEREADIDIRLIGEGYGTVSMIKYDLNDYKGLEKLKEWEIKL
jgi:5'-nucleotidase